MKSESSFNRDLGNYGEELIANHLIKDGYSIISRNFHKRGGEIDIIAKKGEVLAFVEVKLRQDIYFNNSEIIVRSKMRKIIQTAKIFLSENKFVDHIIRFDVAIVEKIDGKYQINYIENAFNGD